MKYILLAYRDTKQWESMSRGEHAAFEEACRTSERDLSHSLHLLDVTHLQDTTALTIRIVDGTVSLTDGAASVAQEQLIQLLFIEARDFNAAVQIASNLPQAREGSVEVRAIAE